MSDTDLYKHRSDCATAITTLRAQLAEARAERDIWEIDAKRNHQAAEIEFARADAAEAALDKAAALIEERHVVHMTAKGRNPKDYISEWSLIAKEVRAMLAELKGESHE